MSGRFLSDLLDLSRLPPPDAIRSVTYETILAERKARLLELFTAAGIEFDVADLETDPAIILEQTDAYREMLAMAAINDAVRAVLLAFSTGANLEHLATLYGVRRLEGEGDERLRRRVQLAPDAYGAAGSEGGYVYWALTADQRVSDAVAIGPSVGGLRPGQVHVIIATEAEDESAVLDTVSRTLFRRDIKPLTDMLSVRLAKRVSYQVKGEIEIARGPDPAVVLSQATARVLEYQAARRRIGAVVARTGLSGALHTPAAERVNLMQPAADIDPGHDGIAVAAAPIITTRVVGA